MLENSNFGLVLSMKNEKNNHFKLDHLIAKLKNFSLVLQP